MPFSLVLSPLRLVRGFFGEPPRELDPDSFSLSLPAGNRINIINDYFCILRGSWRSGTGVSVNDCGPKFHSEERNF